jgi:hypothetical protein
MRDNLRMSSPPKFIVVRTLKLLPEEYIYWSLSSDLMLLSMSTYFSPSSWTHSVWENNPHTPSKLTEVEIIVTCNREVSASNAGQGISTDDWGFPSHLSVSADKRRNVLQVGYNHFLPRPSQLSANCHIIRRHIIWDTNSVVKQTINQYIHTKYQINYNSL